MKNKEVAKLFCEGSEAHSLTLYSDGEKLWSYNTVIVQRVYNVLGHYCLFIINNTKYSSTTSRHLNYALQYLKEIDAPYVYTHDDNIPYSTTDLRKHCNL